MKPLPSPEIAEEVVDFPRESMKAFYTKYFVVDACGRKNEDLCYLLHNNGVCVICLAPSHPLVSQRDVLFVQNVNFQVRDKVNRLENAVKGKKKKSAQQLCHDSILCRVTCVSGTEFTIRAGVKAKLIEANAAIQNDGRLLQTDPEWRGHIAIIQPSADRSAFAESNGLLSAQDYRRLKLLDNTV
ncbi:Protein FAM206A [Trichuris trichiura]|uniref:Protein FAM206A n=1 Tax=Trichuris trichiura TaxID=36087 RepID=A0A077ZGZ4_TRITR|nr:Protein FAM206A [Trichuris trichiura]